MIDGKYLTLLSLYEVLNNKKLSYGILLMSILLFFYMNLVWLMVLAITALATPFSIYMLLVLYKHDKRGWVAGFLILMAVSFIPLFFFSGDNLQLIGFRFAPLLAFVLYTIILRMQVGEWLIELDYEQNLKTNRKQK